MALPSGLAGLGTPTCSLILSRSRFATGATLPVFLVVIIDGARKIRGLILSTGEVSYIAKRTAVVTCDM